MIHISLQTCHVDIRKHGPEVAMIHPEIGRRLQLICIVILQCMKKPLTGALGPSDEEILEWDRLQNILKMTMSSTSHYLCIKCKVLDCHECLF